VLRARVDENDRGNLTAGQAASVAVDTLPGETFTARAGALAGLANRASFFESASVTRLFDVTFEFDNPDPRLKAGASARVTIQGKEIPDALHVPRQAVFAKKGKTYVFVKVGDRFEEREVKVDQRTESRVVVAGLAEGTEIALVDPTARPAGPSQPSAPPVPAAGGPR
jgi:membrane fusion protein (multidrug efflux system)